MSGCCTCCNTCDSTTLSVQLSDKKHQGAFFAGAFPLQVCPLQLALLSTVLQVPNIMTKEEFWQRYFK
jgi:hypothetical protein